MRKIITIAREFGAGGGEIGRRVAKELGIEYYDKDIILRTALADPKLTPEEVRKWDERVPQTFGFAQSLLISITNHWDNSSGRHRWMPFGRWQVTRVVSL